MLYSLSDVNININGHQLRVVPQLRSRVLQRVRILSRKAARMYERNTMPHRRRYEGARHDAIRCDTMRCNAAR